MKKNRLRGRAFLLVVTMGLLLSNVTDVRAEESMNQYEQNVKVTKPSKMKKLDLKVQNYCMLHCGEKMQLTVGGKKATNWKSSNSKIVSVNSNGVITACDISGDYLDKAKRVYITCKRNGVTYKCLVTNGRLLMDPTMYYYKDQGKKFEESIFATADMDDSYIKGFRFYNTKDKKIMEEYNGKYNNGVHIVEQPVKEEKWSSSAPDVAEVTKVGAYKYRIVKKKAGTSDIKVTFTTYAGYRYTIKKTIHFLTQTREEAYDEMLNNAEEYFEQWKAENRIQYTEEEVAQKLAVIIKDFPEGENYKDNKCYEKEWKIYTPFGNVLNYTAEGFSYIFASKINSMVYGTKQCAIEMKDTGKYVYSTKEQDYKWLFGGEYEEGIWFEYSMGYANGCSGFSKMMDHFTNNYDRIRVGDIVINRKDSERTRAGIVLSKSEEAIHVIFSNKTTYYTDWTRSSLERNGFVVITRYE